MSSWVFEMVSLLTCILSIHPKCQCAIICVVHGEYMRSLFAKDRGKFNNIPKGSQKLNVLLDDFSSALYLLRNLSSLALPSFSVNQILNASFIYASHDFRLKI